MMQQYRYQTFDNEPNEPSPSEGAYTRILRGIYAKGAAAVKTSTSRPSNPYKRSDYQLAWDTGFDDAYLSTPQGIAEMQRRYEDWEPTIPF